MSPSLSQSALGRWPCCRSAVFVFTIFALTSASSYGATLRSDGFLEIEGEPFFPLGLMDLGAWKYEDWQSRIEKSRANCVWDFRFAYEDTTPSCRAVVDSAVAGNYHLLIGSGDTIQWDDPSTPELEVSAPLYEAERIESLLECAADHPEVILGFTNRDEPAWTLSRDWLGDIDAAHILDTYRHLHVAVPGTFLATNFAPVHLSGDFDEWREALDPFLGATDVVMHASYPYPAGPGTCGAWNVLGYPDCKLDRLAVNADLFLGEINRPGQPLWMVIQAFKNIPAREARWAAYASVVHGATGIFWAGWTWRHDLGDGDASWPVIVPVIQEVRGLHDFLVGRDVPGARADHPDIDVRARRHRRKGEVAAFAISRNGFSGPVRVRLPHAGTGPVEIVGEGRILQATDGWVTDRFESYAAHVYRYPALRPDGATEQVPRAELAFSMTAFPVPSRGDVVVRFTLPREASVTVTVYDTGGRRVALAGTGNYEEGVADLAWNGRDDQGDRVPPGFYFLRGATSTGDVASAKILLEH